MAWFAKLPLVEKVGWSVLGLILLGVLFVALNLGLRTLNKITDNKDRVGLKIEFVKTVASIFGGLFFLATLYFTWANLEATKEKQITDLYVKAIEQLGRPTLEERLGGIYALERIAEDSEKYHWPIMEVLTAYVRVNVPWPPPIDFEAVKERRPWAKERPIVPPPFGFASELKQDADIQAVLTVIGRRSRSYDKGEAQSIDLSKTDLRFADLKKAHLEGADLTFANLMRADLRDAHLEKAILIFADLKGTIIRDAHLEEAILVKAQMGGADFRDSYLKGAEVPLADFTGVKTLKRDQVILTNSWPMAIFDASFLKELGLPPDHYERLQKKNLSSYNLEGVNFRKAILDFNLQQTNLKGAHLEGADLTKAKGLTREQIYTAYYDDKTKFPPSLMSSGKKKPQP